MNRRDFLRGALIGTSAAAGTALIKLATPTELAMLETQKNCLVGQPEMWFPTTEMTIPDPLVYMRAVRFREGRLGMVGDPEFIPIGYLRKWEITIRSEEEISWRGEATIVPGLKTGRLEFEGYGK